MLKKVLLGLSLCLLTGSVVAIQECKVSIVETAPSAQFTVQGNGSTVLDVKTRLIWKRCSEGQTWDVLTSTCADPAVTYTWKESLEAAQANNSLPGFTGETDWRVPNVTELASIVELSCRLPSINTDNVFRNTIPYKFWTSSPFAGSDERAWIVSFYDGGVGTTSKFELAHVRLVRGGQ